MLPVCQPLFASLVNACQWSTLYFFVLLLLHNLWCVWLECELQYWSWSWGFEFIVPFSYIVSGLVDGKWRWPPSPSNILKGNVIFWGRWGGGERLLFENGIIKKVNSTTQKTMFCYNACARSRYHIKHIYLALCLCAKQAGYCDFHLERWPYANARYLWYPVALCVLWLWVFLDSTLRVDRIWVQYSSDLKFAFLCLCYLTMIN